MMGEQSADIPSVDTTRCIDNVRVQVCDPTRAVAIIEDARIRRERLCVAFLNVHLANWASRLPTVRSALAGCFVLNDGVGVDIASKLQFGRAFPFNLNGTDFVPNLLDRMKPALRIYLLGSSQEVIDKAALYYRSRWPQHNVVGADHGFFSADEEPHLSSRIKEAAPDIVLAGMGCPRQELWLTKNIPGVAPIGIGVGALFDFQTGKVPRAPSWLRNLRLEWFFRLLIEPRRMWRRYILGNAIFMSRTFHRRIFG